MPSAFRRAKSTSARSVWISKRSDLVSSWRAWRPAADSLQHQLHIDVAACCPGIGTNLVGFFQKRLGLVAGNIGNGRFQFDGQGEVTAVVLTNAHGGIDLGAAEFDPIL